MFIYLFFFGFGLYTIYCLIHWKMREVPSLSLKFPYLSPFYLLNGDLVCKRNMIENYYHEMKTNGYKYAAVTTLGRSVIIVKDIDIVNDLLMKSDKYFDNKGFHDTDMDWPLPEDVTVFDGRNWKEMRYVLSPQTLCDKLQPLFDDVLNVIAYLVEAIEDCVLEKRDIDVRELLACFTTDVITYHCYKVNCYSYKRSRSKFCKCASDRLGFSGPQNAEEDISRLLYQTIRKYMGDRKSGNYKNFDFFSLDFFMNKWSRDKEEPLLFYKIVDRVKYFFYCSFDVCSTTLYFALYELCRNFDIQNKVRKEIENVVEKYGQPLTWEILTEMKYLDQVIYETLRMYSPVANVVKWCRKNGCQLKGTEVKISGLIDVVVPNFCLHRDPDHFPDPDKFDPERFDENMTSKNPPFFMPYGAGLRGFKSIQMCMIQTKVGLVEILRNFKLSLSSKTCLPLKVCPKIYVEPNEVLYINAEKI